MKRILFALVALSAFATTAGAQGWFRQPTPNAGETSALLTVAPKGDEFFAMKNVPHGAVAERYYWSEPLKQMRRMHVWTPSGYEKSSEKLPVLYLIHGGGDTDNSWPGVGAAGFILDNLMAEGKMKPMVVVMRMLQNHSSLSIYSP